MEPDVVGDTDVIADFEEHLKKDVPCDYAHEGCQHPAKWKALMVGCGHIYTICTPHKARMKAHWATKHMKWVCGESGLEITNITFTEL